MRLLGNRSFVAIATGLPLIVVALVVAVGWEPFSRANVSHDHGSNPVHTHWHTHDVGIDHGHSHPGITQIAHAHLHQHGHVHSATLQPRFGGQLIQVGHVHERGETRTYWAEFAASAEAVDLHLLVESAKVVTEWRLPEVIMANVLVDRRPHAEVEFRPDSQGYRAELPRDIPATSSVVVALEGVPIEAGRFDFSLWIR